MRTAAPSAPRQVAAREAGRVGGAVALDADDEHALAVGQADRAAHALGDAAGATATPSRGVTRSSGSK